MATDAAGRRLADLLIEQRLTIATAESCTGGLVAHRITTVAGSSAYFLGGVVAYSNDVKQSLLGVSSEILARDGAVSRACALAMARGIRERIGADVGIATTGIAGPTGATPAKPVGLVYVACVTPWGESCEEHVWPGDRIENIRLSAEAILQLVIDEVERGRALSR